MRCGVNVQLIILITFIKQDTNKGIKLNVNKNKVPNYYHIIRYDNGNRIVNARQFKTVHRPSTRGYRKR